MFRFQVFKYKNDFKTQLSDQKPNERRRIWPDVCRLHWRVWSRQRSTGQLYHILLNCPDFEWDQKSGSSTILNLGKKLRLFVKNHLKSGQNCLGFEWPSFGVVGTITVSKGIGRPFENRTSWNLILKRSGFERFQFLIIWFQIPSQCCQKVWAKSSQILENPIRSTSKQLWKFKISISKVFQKAKVSTSKNKEKDPKPVQIWFKTSF